MNIVYLRYAITVAKAGSLTKAAEQLFVAQPNLSRAIKELEKELEVTIFDRNSKGIKLTSDGEKLIASGKKILQEIDEVESRFRSRKNNKSVFSVTVPSSGYVAEAFAEFSEELSKEEHCEIFYREAGSKSAVADITDNGCKLGIIRYAARYDKNFKEMLAEKSVSHELIAEFEKVFLVGKNSPLASLESVGANDLGDYTEIAFSDWYVPGITAEEVKTAELVPDVKRRIFVSGLSEMLEILATNPRAFARSCPLSQEIASRYGIVRLRSDDDAEIYKDVLIYPAGYKLTARDRAFIDALCVSKRKCIK